MCGIAGLWTRNQSADTLEDAAVRMASTLTQRGPDAEGVWVDGSAGLAVAHRRLSILDLSSAGAQPMISHCGRWVLTYNGEIYDFGELKRELEGRGRRFRGHSDTEVLCNAIAEWGVETSLARVNGMFAFAAWDRHERQLWLARDRVGIKPLVYGRDATGALLFASETRAFESHPAFEGRLDPDGVEVFLRTAGLPAPHSIYCGVTRVAPGEVLRFDEPTGEPRLRRRYWSAARRFEAQAKSGGEARFEENVERALELLRRSVRRRLVADVPVGAFLSGGIDSSLVAALVAEAGGEAQTFSVGFPIEQYDESGAARETAALLGTRHHELPMTAADALAIVPEIPRILDEPLGDSSIVPTFVVSRFARQHVTVALSGDGGDELFAGYGHQRGVARQWRRLARTPRLARRAAGLLARLASRSAPTLAPFPRIARQARRVTFFGDRVSRVAEDPTELYWHWVGYWLDPSNAAHPVSLPEASIPGAEIEHQVMLQDFSWYLPAVLLTKLDRASMAVSLEARVPLLDHELVEEAWTMPLDHKLRNGVSKALLREALGRYLPREPFDARPKRGFTMPLGEWMRKELRDWTEAALSPSRLRDLPGVDADEVTRRWQQHASGRVDWRNDLWNVCVLSEWWNSRRDSNSTRPSSSSGPRRPGAERMES